jgi:cell division protein FtsW (lipid II flippase)
MRRRIFLAALGSALVSVPVAAVATSLQHRRRGAWIEARKKIEAAGFTNIEGLKMDSNGVWHAVGHKEGNSYQIALSRDGSVSAQELQ